MFGGIFHDYLEGPWEQARGFLREELEQLRDALNGQWAQVFDTDGSLTESAITGSGASAPVPSYVANTGPKKKPKWDKIDLIQGVKSRLQYVNIVAATRPSVLLGRESASAGNWEEITLDPLYERMNGTVLTFSQRAASAIELELHAQAGSLGFLETMI